jgi:hypothetical protein
MRDSEFRANQQLQRPKDSPNWMQGRGPNREPAHDRATLRHALPSILVWGATVVALLGFIAGLLP